MTNENIEPTVEPLGKTLKKAREKAGFNPQELVKETKISLSNLKAMEADDFNALPADAFCRGFYTIYAKTVNLDPEEMVARFMAERTRDVIEGSGDVSLPSSGKYAKEVSSMALPTQVSPTSTIGYILLLLVILGGGLCWYFEINPATYLSEKLRGVKLQETVPDSPPVSEDTPADIPVSNPPETGNTPTSSIIEFKPEVAQFSLSSQRIFYRHS